MRPPEKRHEPWVGRVTGQLLAAYRALEDEFERRRPEVRSDAVRQADVTVAVAWTFTQRMLSAVVPAAAHPRLVAFSAAAEELPEFIAAPHGDGTVRR